MRMREGRGNETNKKEGKKRRKERKGNMKKENKEWINERNKKWTKINPERKQLKKEEKINTCIWNEKKKKKGREKKNKLRVH